MLLFGCTIFVWIARSECKTQTDTATRHRWQLCTQYYSSQVRRRTETCLQDKVSIFNHSLQDIQINTSNIQLYNLLLLSCILAHCWREEIHDSATCIPFDLCRSFSVNTKTKSQKVVSTTVSSCKYTWYYQKGLIKRHTFILLRKSHDTQLIHFYTVTILSFETGPQYIFKSATWDMILLPPFTYPLLPASPSNYVLNSLIRKHHTKFQWNLVC